jgi:CDP-diacylglycerol--serine O-phosphatidyltransferase
MIEMKKKLLGYYDYTVILTYGGMLFAFAGILRAISDCYGDAVICLMAAGICDMFDGAVAATRDRTKQEKRFGIQIDSLSDLISFGVLPAILVYMIAKQELLAAVVCGMYALAALIRLAYFNVLEEARQDETSEKRDSYLGVPVTVIAILLPALYLLYDHQIIKEIRFFVLLLLVMAVCFLVPVHIRKPKLIGKICLVAVGVAEAVSVIGLLGWGAI